MELKNNLPHFVSFGNSLTEEYVALVAAFKALQLDYEKIGFRNDAVYAQSCHALDNADKSMNKMLEIIKAGEGMEDVWKNQQAGSR
jgi:hypothetical protein